MDDLISRQAAIDALFELYEYQRDIDPTEAADLVRQGIYLAEKKIEQLPSAQPEPCNDTISRKAAIEEMKGHRALYCDNTPDTFSKLSYAEKSRVDELDTAIATLVNLPSAQPEIIHCRDCNHWSRESICDGFCSEDCMRHDEDFYCGYAERRTDE